MLELLLFTADWCKPCEIVKKYINNYSDRFNVQIIDVEEHPDIASAHLVRNLPTVIVKRDGKVIGAIVGAFPEPQFKQKLEAIL